MGRRDKGTTVRCNWPIRGVVGPIKGGILSNKVKSRSGSQSDNPLLTSLLGDEEMGPGTN